MPRHLRTGVHRKTMTNQEIPRLLNNARPRIRLLRSFDEQSHSYLGYVLRIDGTCGGQAREFLIAVGKGAHEKHRFHTGMELSGYSLPVEDPRKVPGRRCTTLKRIGSMMTPPPIGGRMISPFRQAQMLERAQGCLLGQLAGDSLGSLVEFRVPDDIRRKYPKGFRELADGDNRVEILNSSLGGLADGQATISKSWS